jgi:hypothetical protein
MSTPSSTSSGTNKHHPRDSLLLDGDIETGYYEYRHGLGQHVLVRQQQQNHWPASMDDGQPQYSLHCCLCHCVDGLVLVAVFAFLGFSLYLAYYALNNYGGG